MYAAEKIDMHFIDIFDVKIVHIYICVKKKNDKSEVTSTEDERCGIFTSQKSALATCRLVLAVRKHL